jgi:hypothetical protein
MVVIRVAHPEKLTKSQSIHYALEWQYFRFVGQDEHS